MTRRAVRRSLFLGFLMSWMLIVIPFVDAEPLNIKWDAVTTNTDGSPLGDFVGYVVYWGTTKGVHPNRVVVGNVTRTSIGNLSPSTVYYFVVVGIDQAGNESPISNETSGRPRRVSTF